MSEGATGRTVLRRFLVAAVVVVLALAFGVAGPAGLLVALTGLAVIALLVRLVQIPSAPPHRRRPRRPVPVANAPYRSYRQIAEQLSWGQVSPRHYDLVTRPMLTRLLAARLADRRRIELDTDPEAARAAVGEQVWEMVSPQRPVSGSSQPPGVDRRTRAMIVDRLEHL
ncbi:MAG: hypothetical protein QOJ60_1339 [Actinomycetota bacterium]|nr:hypothetical protein [Actinomycetota bacterium]